MKKIKFINNSKPALNATNLNQLQDNIEEDINIAKAQASDAVTKVNNISGDVGPMKAKLDTIEEGAQKNVDEVIISQDRPDSGKIWINPEEEDKPPMASEVINSLDGNETTLAPSVNAVKKLLVYSTEEQKTGATWINGKPLYRKTFRFTPTEGGEQIEFAHNIPNVEDVFINPAFTYLLRASGTKQYGIGNDGNDGYWFNPRYVLYNNQRVGFKIGGSIWSGSTLICTLEYTKTTD